MKNYLLVITAIISSCHYLSAQNVSAPKYSNEFLNIGVGARALGMGRSQAAHVNDVTAGYWNPAGIVDIASKYDVAYMHNEYYAGIAKYDYAAIGRKIDSSSSIALTYIRFGVDDIPDTRYLFDSYGGIDYGRVKYFSATDNAFILTYASKIKKIPGLKLGANFKVIYRNVGSFANAWGFGLDGGAQYKLKNWMFGASVRDVTSTFNVWTINSGELNSAYLQSTQLGVQNTVPSNSIELTLPTLVLGAGRYFNLTKNKKFGLLGSIDFNCTFDGKRNVAIKSGTTSIDPRVGFEVNYIKTIFIRAGAGGLQQQENFEGNKYKTWDPNFGVGVKIKILTIDYSLTNLNNLSDGLYSNVISLRLNLN